MRCLHISHSGGLTFQGRLRFRSGAACGDELSLRFGIRLLCIKELNQRGLAGPVREFGKSQGFACLVDGAACQSRDAGISGIERGSRICNRRLRVGQNAISPRFGRLNVRPGGRDITLIAIEQRKRHRQARDQRAIARFAKLPHADADRRIETAFGASLAQLSVGDCALGFGEAHVECL